MSSIFIYSLWSHAPPRQPDSDVIKKPWMSQTQSFLSSPKQKSRVSSSKLSFWFDSCQMKRSLKFIFDAFVTLFWTFASFFSFVFNFTEGETSWWDLSSLFCSWENLLFICSPTFPSPPPLLSFSFSFSFIDVFLMLPRENLFFGSFLSVGSENLLWEDFPFLRLSKFSLSRDRDLFLLRFLSGSAPFRSLQAFSRGDFFFFFQTKVVLEEDPPIVSWPLTTGINREPLLTWRFSSKET